MFVDGWMPILNARNSWSSSISRQRKSRPSARTAVPLPEGAGYPEAMMARLWRAIIGFAQLIRR
jgi:hypothetical protein